MMNIFGWWAFAEEAARRVASPRPNVVESDREVEDVIRHSAIARGAAQIGSALDGMRSSSRVVTILADARDWIPSAASAIRLVAVGGAAASATALVLERTGPAPTAPMTWMLPAATAIAAVLVFCGAGPLARAFDDKSR